MKDLYRKKHVDKVSSPEQLNEYIHVATPGSFILLLAITILFIGGIVWSFFGKIEITLPSSVICNQGVCYVYTKAENKEVPNEAMKVRISGNEYSLSKVSEKPVLIADEEEYFLYQSGLKKGEFYYISEVKDFEFSDGIYDGYIITESKKPIDFLIK